MYPDCSNFHLYLWGIWNLWILFGECRKKYELPNGFCWEHICPWKAGQRQNKTMRNLISLETWDFYTSAWKDNHRTNSAVEGWHGKFQKMMLCIILQSGDLLKSKKMNNKAMNKLWPRFLMITLRYDKQLHDDINKMKFV